VIPVVVGVGHERVVVPAPIAVALDVEFLLGVIAQPDTQFLPAFEVAPSGPVLQYGRIGHALYRGYGSIVVWCVAYGRTAVPSDLSPSTPATDRLPFGNVVGGVFFLDVLNYGHTRTAGEDRNVDLGAETGRS